MVLNADGADRADKKLIFTEFPAYPFYPPHPHDPRSKKNVDSKTALESRDPPGFCWSILRVL